jgi:hypothetical protein
MARRKLLIISKRLRMRAWENHPAIVFLQASSQLSMSGPEHYWACHASPLLQPPLRLMSVKSLNITFQKLHKSLKLKLGAPILKVNQTT